MGTRFKLSKIYHQWNFFTQLIINNSTTGNAIVYGWSRGFSATSAEKTLQYLQIVGKFYIHHRVFPADISEKHLDHPVNPCKHLQCNFSKDVQWVKIISELFCLLKFKANPNLTKNIQISTSVLVFGCWHMNTKLRQNTFC